MSQVKSQTTNDVLFSAHSGRDDDLVGLLAVKRVLLEYAIMMERGEVKMVDGPTALRRAIDAMRAGETQ